MAIVYVKDQHGHVYTYDARYHEALLNTTLFPCHLDGTAADAPAEIAPQAVQNAVVALTTKVELEPEVEVAVVIPPLAAAVAIDPRVQVAEGKQRDRPKTR